MSSSLHLSSLKILSWNGNELLNKINYLRDHVEHTDFDIILVQETKFYSVARFNISNYTLYRQDRVVNSRTPQGGLVIYVHRKINHYQITDLTTDLLELNSVMILIKSNIN